MTAEPPPAHSVPADGAPAGSGESAGRQRRRRRRRRAVLILVLVLALAAIIPGVAIARSFGGSDDGSTGTDTGTATTLATVTRGRLTARTPVNGTLGYAGSYKVMNRASGTFTKLPRVGQTISAGQVLYRVSGLPVIMLQGSSTPVYRDLTRGTRGPDVRQLNANLVALHYASRDDLDPDSTYFGWATQDAVEELQDDLNVEETGKLTLGTVVFLPTSKIRVTEVGVDSGGIASAGAQVLKVSSTNRQITVALDASGQANVKVGDKVEITLPNLKSTEGVVSTVGTVAKSTDDGGPTIDVEITPRDSKATGELDQAPVQVSIVTDTVDNVLAVPVNALLALAGGGYAVEVVDAAGTHRLVPVTVGLFDDTAGMVAVSGTGLAEGQRVVVPTS